VNCTEQHIVGCSIARTVRTNIEKTHGRGIYYNQNISLLNQSVLLIHGRKRPLTGNVADYWTVCRANV